MAPSDTFSSKGAAQTVLWRRIWFRRKMCPGGERPETWPAKLAAFRLKTFATRWSIGSKIEKNRARRAGQAAELIVRALFAPAQAGAQFESVSPSTGATSQLNDISPVARALVIHAAARAPPLDQAFPPAE